MFGVLPLIGPTPRADPLDLEIFGKSDIFVLWHFLNGPNFFNMQVSYTGLWGLLELCKIYKMYLTPISKLASALFGDVIKVAENPKFQDFDWFSAYNFLISKYFFTVFWKTMHLNRSYRNNK